MMRTPANTIPTATIHAITGYAARERSNGAAADLTPQAAPPPVTTTPARRLLSPSQIAQWLECSFAWYAERMLGEASPPTASMCVGTGVHAALAAAISHPSEFELGDLTAMAQSTLSAELETARLQPDDNQAELMERCARMVAVLYHDVLPTVPPAKAEQPLFRPIGSHLALRGVADVLTGAQVIELKTASRKPASLSPRHRFQAQVYATLADRPTSRVITIHASKQLSAATSHTVPVQTSDQIHVTQLALHVAASIDAHVYTPNRLSQWCTRRHCAHWQLCQAEFGGEVPA